MVTERQKEILNCVVDSYIDNAQPMSSKMLLDMMNIKLSSATIRQVFSKLDDLGYLQKLHTSSGRIPTDKGYRLVVNEMDVSDSSVLSLSDYMDKTSITQKVRQFFNLFIDNVAEKMPYIPVMIYHSKFMTNIECVKYVQVHSMVGLILIYHNIGLVSECYVTFQKEMNLSDTDGLVDWMMKQLQERQTFDMNEARNTFSGDDYEFIDVVSGELLKHGYLQPDDYTFLYRNQNKCIQLSDFTDKESIQNLLDALDTNQSLVTMLMEIIRKNQLTYYIGSDMKDYQLQNCSLVGLPIMLDGNCIGCLGIVGPIRMDYKSIIKLLTSDDIMSEFLNG